MLKEWKVDVKVIATKTFMVQAETRGEAEDQCEQAAKQVKIPLSKGWRGRDKITTVRWD